MRAAPISVLFGCQLLCFFSGCDSEEPSCPSAHRCTTVAPDGSGDYPTIQAAIEAARDGEVIELATGTFTGAGNRDLDYLGKAITIRSASGRPEDCCLDCEYSGSQGVNFRSGEGSSSILEGVTITRGSLFWPGGAGVQCFSASPTFIRCILLRNSGGAGAAGVFCMGSSPQFIGCEFRGNLGAHAAGAIILFESPSVVFVDCIFDENHSEAGGAVVQAIRSNFSMLRCRLHDNGSTTSGGALWLVESRLVLDNCIISGSYAGIHGSCLTGWASNVLFSNCTLSGAHSPLDGAAICAFHGAHILLERTLLTFGASGPSVNCSDSSQVEARCTDVFGNAGGDWVGCLEQQFGTIGNVAADPLYCDVEADDFRLCRNSPCSSDANPRCGVMGALSDSCSLCLLRARPATGRLALETRVTLEPH